MRRQLSNAIKHWVYIAPIIKYPKNAKEFNALVSVLDELLTIVGDDEKHQLMGLVDILSYLIASYEEKHCKHQQPTIKGVDVLKFLMQEHNLKQSDLAEVGSQGVISEILTGKRKLNLRQMKLLAHRFNVDFLTFVDE